jgi:putative ABC transport system permease protein
VATSIPLAYGDNAQGFRIVGTNHSYAKLYDLNIQEGRLWEAYFEVTVGHVVAKALNLSLGDTLISAHGLVGNLEEHDSHPYIVRGIFEPSSSPIDRLILTDIHSIWEAHSDHGHDEKVQVDAHNHANEEYTAVLIKFRSLAGLMQLPRLVNEETSMQAAVPSIEMDRLLNLIGNGAFALQIAGVIILILSAISLFTQIYRSFQKRRYEWALMRVYGASSFYASTVLLLEAIWIAVLGIISGWMLARLSQWLLSRLELSPLLREISIPLFGLSDAYLIVAVFSIALIAAIVPIAKGVRMDLSETLSG